MRERGRGGGESVSGDFTVFLIDWQRASPGHILSSRTIRRSWICLLPNHSTSSLLLMKKVASPRYVPLSFLILV